MKHYWKKFGKRGFALFLTLLMLLSALPISAMAKYVTYKSTITLYPGGASPTGVNMSVGDSINGHWKVVSISTSSVTFGSPYGEHNNSFNIPDPGRIWKGVTYDYTTEVRGSAFFNAPKVGANGHIIYTAGSAKYYNMKAASSSSGGGVTDPGTTNPPGSSSGSSGSGSHTFYTQVVYVAKDKQSFSYGNKYALQSNVRYDYGYTLSRSQFTPQAWGITTPTGYKFAAWQIGTPDNYQLKGNWWTVDSPGNTTDLYSTVQYQNTVVFTGSNNTVYLVYLATQDPVSYNYILNWEYNGGTKNGLSSRQDTALKQGKSTYTFYENEGTPIRPGYTFTSWAYSGNGTYTRSNGQINMTGKANDTVTGTMTAQWSVNPASSLTLTYNANGGTNAPASQSGTPGTVLTIKDKGSMTKSGYTFEGWSLNPNATPEQADIHPGDEWTLNDNVTLYAVWKQQTTTQGMIRIKVNFEGLDEGDYPEDFMIRVDPDREGIFAGSLNTPSLQRPVEKKTNGTGNELPYAVFCGFTSSFTGAPSGSFNTGFSMDVGKTYTQKLEPWNQLKGLDNYNVVSIGGVAGATYATGSFTATADMGNGSVVPTMEFTIVYAKKDASYKVQWFDKDTGAPIKGSETRQGKSGDSASVTDDDKIVAGYTFDANDNRNKLTATLVAGRTSVLKLYFTKNETKAPELSIEKSVNKASVKVGNELEYTITVKNEGTAAATNVIVKDTLPEELTYVSKSTVGAGECSATGNALSWNLGTIAAGGSVEFTFKAKADKTGHIENNASVTSDEIKTPVTTDDDPAETAIYDFAVTKKNDGFVSEKGTGKANVHYTVTVTNTGDINLYGLNIRDVLTPEIKVDNVAATEAQADLVLKNVEVDVADKTLAGNDDLKATEATTTTWNEVLVRGAEFAPGVMVTLEYDIEITNNTTKSIYVNLNNTATCGTWTTPVAVYGLRNASTGDYVEESANSSASTGTSGAGGTIDPVDPDPDTVTVTFIDGYDDTEIPDSKITDWEKGVEVPEENYPDVPTHEDKVFDGWKVETDPETGDITITALWKDKTVDPGPGPGPVNPDPDEHKLALTKKVNGEDSIEVKPGSDPVTYTITVTNNTGVELQDLLIRDKMPAGVTLEANSGAVTVNEKAGTVTDSVSGEYTEWTVVGIIPVGAEVVLTYRATVTATEATKLTNTAIAYANEYVEPTPAPANLVLDFSAALPEATEELPAIVDTPTDAEPSDTEETADTETTQEVTNIDEAYDLPGDEEIKTFAMERVIDKMSFGTSGTGSSTVTVTVNGKTYVYQSNEATATITVQPSDPGPGPGQTEYTITVKYVDEDGNKIADDATVTTTNGGEYNVTGKKVAIPDYTFDHADGALEGTATEDTEIVLTYKKNTVTPPTTEEVTITYKDADGNTIGTPEKVEKGTEITIKDPPTAPEGKEFDKWQDEDGKDYKPGDKVTPEGDLTLTVVWKDKTPVNPDPEKVTVTWLNGYNDTPIQVKDDHVKGTDVSRDDYPTNPTRNGYTFSGWGDPVVNPETGNITITATWTRDDGGNGGGGTRPRPNPTPTPNPGTEIEDPDVPLAELPDENVEIPDTDVPLAELPDEDVPLAEVPHTGDMTAIWYTTAILAAGCWFYLQRKKTGETS